MERPGDGRAPGDGRNRGGLRALAADLPAVTRTALLRRGFAAARVVSDWPEIVGPALADGSLPERLIRDRHGDGATLVIRVRPAAALELQHWTPQVIERINSRFGFRAVTRLKLMQGPVSPRHRPPPHRPQALDPAVERQLDAALAPLCDDTVREALRRLGRAVLGRAPGS